MHIVPQTDHGFDLLWPNIAPAAHNAFYDVERFMGANGSTRKISRTHAYQVSKHICIKFHRNDLQQQITSFGGIIKQLRKY